jgi:hypothetical protein
MAWRSPPERPFIIGRFRGDFFGATLDGSGTQQLTLSNSSTVELLPPQGAKA